VKHVGLRAPLSNMRTKASFPVVLPEGWKEPEFHELVKEVEQPVGSFGHGSVGASVSGASVSAWTAALASRDFVGPPSLPWVLCDPERGVDKATMRGLSSCQWVKSKHNVVVVGKTGVGKSYVGAALADVACRAGCRANFFRVPRLLQELALARASGVYASLFGKLSRVDVLVLDDFLLNPMTDIERRDLLEVVGCRYDKTSTVITTQMPTKTWHEALGDPTIADAICDRLVHNAHLLYPARGPRSSTRDREAAHWG
jgi:IstB-like ATP binding protein